MLETLMRKEGCNHEQRNNANWLRNFSGVPVDQNHSCRIGDFCSAVEYGGPGLGIPEFLQQTQRSKAHTSGKMGSRYFSGKKWKIKRSQFIKLDAMAAAMIVGIVSEMAAANECNTWSDFMESGTAW